MGAIWAKLAINCLVLAPSPWGVNMRTITTFVLATVLGAMLPAPGQAQVLNGSIYGQVTDASNAVAPGAAVRLTHRETNQQRVTTTNVSGGGSSPPPPGGPN